MKFFNKYLNQIYKYIYIHDDQTILLKDIEEYTKISRPTIIKYLRWLERRDLIKKSGKHFKILPT